MGNTGTFLGINCNYTLDAISSICDISPTEGLRDQVVFYCQVFNYPLLGKNYLDNLGPQQKASILKKCIQAKQDGQIPIWYREFDKDKCLAHIEKKSNNDGFTACCFEDYNNLSIDHADKPYNLLKIASDQISHLGAMEKYKIWFCRKLTRNICEC